MYLIILLWLMNTEGLQLDCPIKCECIPAALKCTGVIPSFIPKNTANVTIYNAPYTEKFNFSHPGWGEIKKLSINPHSCEKDKAYNRVLKRQEMQVLKSLEYLQIYCPYLKDMEKGLFSDNKNLTVLDLSNNINLGLKSILNAIEGDSTPNLRELYLSNISVTDVVKYGRLAFSTEFYKAVRTKPLKILDLSKNADGRFDLSPGFYTAFPELECLNMSNSGLLVASFSYLLMNHSNVTSFKHLRCIDISYQSVSSNTMGILLGLLGNGDITIYVYLPNKLEDIYASNLFEYKFNMTGTFEINEICMPIEHSGKRAKICFKGQFSLVKKLDLANSVLPAIYPDIGNSFTSLEHLDVSDNDLGKDIAHDKYLRNCLTKMKNLKHYIASKNKITFIPFDTFKNSKSIEILDLSQNLMEAVTFDTKYLTSLRKLDLSYNRIVSLDSTSIARLDAFLSESINKTTDKLIKTEIAMKGNPFLCTCESVVFMKWLLDISSNTYVCELNQRTVPLDFQAIQYAEYMCKEPIVISVYTIYAISILVLSVVASYKIMKQYRKQKQQKKNNQTIETFHRKARDNSKCPPPVFLSFCSHDDDVIVEHILPKLNSGLETILGTDQNNVGMGVTDVRLGLPIGSEIIRCIENTSVVIFFVTNAFCKSSWCKYEVRIACLENKPMVLMFWEEVDIKLLPAELRKFLPNLTCVYWNNLNGRLVMKPGWGKLCETIIGLMGEAETAL